MGSIKGPGIFLAQFLRDSEPYNNLENIGKWVADLYRTVCPQKRHDLEEEHTC